MEQVEILMFTIIMVVFLTLMSQLNMRNQVRYSQMLENLTIVVQERSIFIQEQWVTEMMDQVEIPI